MDLLAKAGIVRYTVLMQSCLWPLLCFCGYKVCTKRLRVLTKRWITYQELGPHSNCDHVFLTAVLLNYQNRHMENGTEFASIFGMFPRLQTVWKPTGAVINSPSVSVWMPESQLKENLIESASGPSWTGTQMNCAWGLMAGKEKRAWRLNKKGKITKSPSFCWE